MNKNLLLIFTLLCTLPIHAKYIKVFGKESVNLKIQYNNQETKQAQAKIDTALAQNGNKATSQQSPLPMQATQVIIQEPSIELTIAELFEIFIISNCLNSPTIKFFEQYGYKLLALAPQLQNKSLKNKEDKQKLSIMFAYFICSRLNNDSKQIELFVKSFGAQDIQPFPYVAFTKTLHAEIKAIKHNKLLQSLCTKEQINTLHKKLQTIKQLIVQQPNYIYEKQMAAHQSNFSTKSFPNKYNQLLFVDRTTLNYFDTQSGKPQHEIYHDISYAKK